MSLLLACPRDVRRLILSWLDARSLLRFGETCKAAQAMAADPHMWRLLCLSGQEREAQRRIERESHRDWQGYYIWSRHQAGCATFEDFVTAQAECKRNLEAGMRLLGNPAKDRHARKFLETAFRFSPTLAMYERLHALLPDLTMQHGYWEHLTRLRLLRERCRQQKDVDDRLEELVGQMLRDGLYAEADIVLLEAYRRHSNIDMVRRILSVSPMFEVKGDARWKANAKTIRHGKRK